MEIVVLGGLHKSGTTTVQYSFAAAYGDGRAVWYPVLGHPLRAAHYPLVWPYLGTYRRHPLYRAHIDCRLGGPASLDDAVAQARLRGAETLVISAESFDALEDDDVEGLRRAWQGHRVRVLFTVTPPLHRWASLWHELVRWGRGVTPHWMADELLDLANVRTRRLEGLIERFPADEKLVRIISRDHVENDLPGSLARLLGLPWSRPPSTEVWNAGIGEDIALLAHLNSHGVTGGIVSEQSREEFAVHKRLAGGDRIDDFAPEDFAIPDEVYRAAEVEREYLAQVAGTRGVTVHDPDRALDSWSSAGLPTWYEKVRDGSRGKGALLRSPDHVAAHTRATLEARATDYRLANLELLHERLQMELGESREKLRRARVELTAIRSSRTWRWARQIARWSSPLRRIADLFGRSAR